MGRPVPKRSTVNDPPKFRHLVNKQRVDSVVLQQGDEILVGRFRLIFLGPVDPS